MIKKTISYTDFDDVKRTEDFWFHLGKAGIVEIEAATNGLGLEAWIKQVLRDQNVQAVLDMYKRMIGLAVGKRTPEGRFVKSREITEDFVNSEAYGELLQEMFQSPNAGSDFLRSLLAKDVLATVEEVQAKQRKLEEELAQEASGSNIKPLSAEYFNATPTPEEDLLLLQQEYESANAKPKQRRLQEMTQGELLELSADEFYQLAGGTDPKKWPKPILQIALMRRNAGLQ